MSDSNRDSILFSSGHFSPTKYRFGEGWDRPEQHGCWTVGPRSTLVFPPARSSCDKHISIHVRPHIAPGHIEKQRLSIVLNGNPVGNWEVTDRGGQLLEIAIDGGNFRCDGPNTFVFDHPDFGEPRAHFDSVDSRPLSLMFHEISFVDADGRPSEFSTSNSRTLFIVTGACRAGNSLNLELVKFLYSDECDILLWVDFENHLDYASLSNALRILYPRVVICAAPKALWGGGSIVLSMLRALSFAEASINAWSQAIFTSVHDFPLLARQNIIKNLEELSFFDFCSSRWVREKNDITADGQSIILDETKVPSFDIYHYRPDITIRVSAELAAVAPAELIFNGKITHTLRDRYRIAVNENFCTSTLTLAPMSQERAREREKFFQEFELIAGRMWVFTSRNFARLLISNESNDIFSAGFRDVLIPDECFFQSMAEYFSKKGTISALWKNLHYKNANPNVVNLQSYQKILSDANPGEIFARKAVNLSDYRFLLEEFFRERGR